MSIQAGDVLSSFENLSSREQQAFLSLLANSVNVTMLRTLQNSINATRKLTRDFVEEFPLELVVNIFSFLPPATAFLLQRVSKAWQAKLLADPMRQQMREIWNEGQLSSEGRCDSFSLPVIRSRVQTMHRFRVCKPLTSLAITAPFEDMFCDPGEGFLTDEILSIGPDARGNFWIFNLRSGHASQHKLTSVRWAQSYQDRHSILFACAKATTDDEHGFTVFRDDAAAQLLYIDTRSRVESKLLLPASKVGTGARFAFTADRSIVAYYRDADKVTEPGEIGLWRPADRRLVKIQVGHLGSAYLNTFTGASVKVYLFNMYLDEDSRTITLLLAADPRKDGDPLSNESSEPSRDTIMFSIKITYDPDIFLGQTHRKLIASDISVSALRDATGIVLPADMFAMIAELQGCIGTKHAHRSFLFSTDQADLEIDLAHNTYRLSRRSSQVAGTQGVIYGHDVMYAASTLVPWPTDDKIKTAYRLCLGGRVAKYRSEDEWKNCKKGLETGLTSVLGSWSIIVMLSPKYLTLWCFDPDFNIKSGWFDFKKIQIGKIWPGLIALSADD